MTSDERRPAERHFEDFCDCLNRYDVEYVIVGSEAVAFHGVPRVSADFDTFVRATRANLFRIAAALNAFGLNELAQAINPEVWAKTRRTLRLGEPPLQIDLLLQLTDIPFEQAARAALDGTYGSIPVRFMSAEDLIKNKRAVGRPKDLADVAALEAGDRIKQKD